MKIDMLFCRLAYGFIPSEYTSFGLINKTPEERKQYYSDLDTHVFGYTVNNIVEVQQVLNKATSAIKYGNMLRRDFLVVSSNEDYKSYVDFSNQHPVFVKKKVFSSMGKGVELVDITKINKDDYFRNLISNGKWLLEERVNQGCEMSLLNSSSVNTVRVLTFKTCEGVVVPYCILRSGRQGSFVDNAGSGGVLAGIDVSSGIVETDGFDEYGERYIYHPDSGIKFKGFQIPNWERLVNICTSAALEETSMNYLAWDMAYSAQGWCVIEVNEVGQLLLPQLVYQRGLKKVFEDYLNRMPKVI